MKTYLAIVLLAFFFFTTCKKEYSYERGPADMVATGSLQSVSGDCEPVTVGGIYKQNGFLGDSNYVIVQVHFTSSGRYRISTDVQNGFSFQDSAIVTDTGYQSIKLKGIGKPILAQTTNFLVAFDTSYCNFSIPFTNPSANTTSINHADSAWEFNQGTKFFHGYFDGALTTLVNGSTVLTLVGLTGTGDTAIAILANIAGPVVKTGSYKSLTASTFEFFDYTGKSIFTARAATTNVEITVVIIVYDAATQIIEGTFSGTALNESNQPTPITAGKFKARLNE